MAVYNIGILDIPTTDKFIYEKWKQMLRRCYSKEQKPAYAGCTVSNEWLHYSNFYNWFINQQYDHTYDLDKDLLIKGNRLYSEYTCVLIPHQLNAFLANNVKKYSLPLGVKSRPSGKFQARIMENKKSITLGTYCTEMEAHRAWQHKKIQIAISYKELYKNNLLICNGLDRIIQSISNDIKNNIETINF